MALQDELQTREDQLKKIKTAGIAPYPEKFPKDKTIQQALGLKEEDTLSTAGRITSIRKMGKITFCHISDITGKIQVVLQKDAVGEHAYTEFHEIYSLGDFIGVSGEMFVTKSGELSLKAHKTVFLGKALLPLPEKWAGLKDTEIKYRQRYLDLIANQDSKELFVFRSNVIKTLREFYWQHGFHEVETSTLTHAATGAVANPYKTHHDALDQDLFLRISHELPLKELIVGGFDKVFEIGKAFRNEGLDPSHLPEHTHMEHYAAYWNFEDNIDFTEKVFATLFEKLNIPETIEYEDGTKVNFKQPWPRENFVELLKEKTGINITAYTEADELRAAIKKKDIAFEGLDEMSLPGLMDNLYKKVVRPTLINPVFLYGYPAVLQPLARRNDKDENIVDQFQLVINGWEIVKAYSELVDPIDQKERFEEQAESKEEGETEVMEGDDEYITAMKHGMPPISGWGMGVDRLVSLLSGNSNLRDVVLFPLLRKKD
ncbi:MAG: lysine--tRNA ligase [Candidatus Jacksonbacteria bacterium]|jgi:lysyl-tRNA synthetase, class II|nr:lysine--tRNA ligase [Candidatus Jacksonbacteria bacterium]MBT6034769.1 lysine--tRNA ligase [Candidatus Jacksonbacteria bacterium]MBT6301207.1 lysine--tRNA ligase [Candidatus Jacksonbacteria bacterium]MBT6757043.1 lysine--tRNA ligase [Candidatus Jacksonbacteria bacterium]MBT6954810.1 lysine--tRNA ligase [Candidatus Jacksonbacteria bacterium]